MDAFDLLILGGGAAGFSAAIYGRRYGLSVGVVDHSFGGYTATAGTIENYPGVRSADGFALMETMANVILKSRRASCWLIVSSARA